MGFMMFSTVLIRMRSSSGLSHDHAGEVGAFYETIKEVTHVETGAGCIPGTALERAAAELASEASPTH